jgi:hypothetical protein
MRVLRVGDQGEDVRLWQMFLTGQDCPCGTVDGDFGAKTLGATRAFQSAHKLADTGVVDNDTVACAATFGFQIVENDDAAYSGPNWPPAPTDLHPLGQAGREALFGKFNVVPAGLPGNLEAIKIDSKWYNENIEHVLLPTMGGRTNYRVEFHKAGAARLRALFDEWAQDGLLDRVRTWDGSYAPRFIRGSKTVLSAHAWGSAFDINARWNPLGCIPALMGKLGCVRELVARANELGFYWGGHFPGRKDGMHFELVRLP